MGELNQREGEKGNRTGRVQTHSWVENTNMTECTQEIGLSPDKQPPLRPFPGQLIRWRHLDFYTYMSLIFLREALYSTVHVLEELRPHTEHDSRDVRLGDLNKVEKKDQINLDWTLELPASAGLHL